MRIHSDLSGYEYISNKVWGREVPFLQRFIRCPRRLYITTKKYHYIIGTPSQKRQKEGTYGVEFSWFTKHPILQNPTRVKW